MTKTSSLLLILFSTLPRILLGQEGISELAGIRFAYENSSEREIKGVNSDIGYDQWEIRTPFFYSKKNDWTIAAGIRYQSTKLDISNPVAYPFLEDQLHSLDLALFLSRKYSENIDWLLLLNPNLAGDFENTNGDAFNYFSIAGVKWEQKRNLQWIFGAVYTTGIEDDLLLPALGFIWEPSVGSTLVFAGPIIRFNYELSDYWDLNLGGQFTGNRWHTEALYGGNLEKRDFRFRSYRLFANLQYNIGEKHSIFAGASIDFAGEVELETSTNRDERDVENGGNLEVGYQFKF